MIVQIQQKDKAAGAALSDKRLVATGKRIENPAWRDYVCSYNAYYHSNSRYRYNDEQIEARLGPEPERWIEETAIAADLARRIP